ncbi:hypothetical protein N7501_004333 [Penicillium viridicatum]|nr:hypothetical protein N7501_004333 [Penicillium viridicatum]
MPDEATANGKKDSIELWDQLNKFGKVTIRKVKLEYWKPAVLVYTGGLRAVAAFISHAVYWLQTAWSTLEQWIEQAWAKVKEWAHRTAEWFTGAWDTVKGWFGDFRRG